GEALAAAFDDERRNDGEGERDLDDEERPLAVLGLHLYRAADLLHVAAHHVHADAAARDAGHRAGGRETRLEDEVVDLLLAHGVEIALARQAHHRRLALDALGIEAAAVIADLDDDVAALVIGVERDRAGLGLAGAQALGGQLDAVIGGV